jgi:hypothetical protein
VEKEVAAAVDRYEAGRDVDPVDCFRFLYANMPDELVEQMKEFEAALEHEGYRPGH